MSNFYKQLGPISYSKLIQNLNVKTTLNNPNKIFFNTFLGIKNCTKKDLSFIYDDYDLSSLKIKPKGLIISDKKANAPELDNIIKIIVPDVHDAVAKISNIFYRDLNNSEKNKLIKTNIKKNKNISKFSIIKNGCKIGDNVFIGDGTVINENCIIGRNVKIGSNNVIQCSIIGDNVEIESNCSIGQAGFGFTPKNNCNLKIYHIGRVIIQDNSYIGSNCTIDRGSFSDTCIGENVYLDNQVHIAHNVSIGSNSILAGQCGVAGSASIGRYVRMGGQVGIIGHVNIGHNVEIAAKSGVRNSVADNQKIMGDPAINMFSYLKKNLKKNKVG